MDGISGSTSRVRDYDAQELDAIHEDKSTAEIMSQVRRDTNYTKPAVLRGDDKSYRELKAEHHEGHLGEEMGTTAAELGVHLAPEVLETGIAGFAAAAAAPLVAGAMLVKHVNGELNYRDALVAAEAKDETRLAMLASLGLPPSFMQRETDRCLGAANNGKAGRFTMQETLDGKDQAFKAVLQVHCDRGQHAALDALRTKGFDPKNGAESFLKDRPAMYAHYKEDAAFRAGMDSLLWAKANRPTEFEQAIKNLAARDVANAKAHVRVQA